MDILSLKPVVSRRGSAAVLVAILCLAAVAVIGVRSVLGAGGGGGLCQPNSAGPACTVKAHNAFADFQTVSTDGCIFSDTSIEAFESMARPGQGTGLAVFINTFSFDNCAGQMVDAASNIDPATGNPLFTGTATFSTPLNTASASGSAPMFDGTGTQLFTTTVSVSWQAFGPTTTYIDSFHSHVAGVYVTSSHTNSSTRGAIGSGLITDINGNNTAATPTLNALVQNAISGSVLVYQP
jgi:hypothetical protein